MKQNHWSTYDPTWLVNLAEQQQPDKPWLSSALSHCTRVQYESEFYIRFVNANNANQFGAEWQFKECIQLIDQAQGAMMLDILKDNRVGGIEFYSKLVNSSQISSQVSS